MLTWVIPQKKKKLAKQRGSQPNASISQSCEDSASTKAAYRFYENSAISSQAILSTSKLLKHA